MLTTPDDQNLIEIIDVDQADSSKSVGLEEVLKEIGESRQIRNNDMPDIFI